MSFWNEILLKISKWEGVEKFSKLILLYLCKRCTPGNMIFTFCYWILFSPLKYWLYHECNYFIEMFLETVMEFSNLIKFSFISLILMKILLKTNKNTILLRFNERTEFPVVRSMELQLHLPPFEWEKLIQKGTFRKVFIWQEKNRIKFWLMHPFHM